MKKYSLFFLLIFVFTAAFSQRNMEPRKVVMVAGKVLKPTDSAVVKQFFFAGLREKTIQNIPLAKDFFNRILEIDPANDAAMYELAQIAFNKKDLVAAEELAQKAATVNNKNEWYWLLLADIHEQNKNYKLLNYVLDELRLISPEKTDYDFDKANALFLLNKPDEALKIYDELEKKIGLNDEILSGRQEIYLKQGNIPKAAQQLEKLVAANPSTLKYYMLLGELYNANDFKDKALAVFSKAKKIEPENPYIRLALADVYKSQKNNGAYVEELKIAFKQPDLDIDQKVRILMPFLSLFPDETAKKQAKELSALIVTAHPNDAKAFAINADILYQDDQLQEAKTNYQQALKLNSQIYQIWDQLLRIELEQADTKSLIKDGEEALTLFPNQAALYFYTAIGYSQQKNYDKAISYFKNALNLDTENNKFRSQILASLGDTYHEQKKFKESDAAYDESLKLNPKNAYTLNNYAYFLSLRGDNLDKAENMARLSNELDLNNASFQDTYAWVLFKQKKYDVAKIWIEKAMANNKNKSATQTEHYGDILFKLGEVETAVINWKKAKSLGSKSDILEKKINEQKYFE